MSFKDKIIREKIPDHIAIIMDGNGRWARQKGNVRIFGHQNAVTAVRNVVESSVELGIKFLTLYTFSVENWARPKAEVQALMSLLKTYLRKEAKTLKENNVRLIAIGDIENMPSKVKEALNSTIDYTSGNNGLILCLALNYGSRREISNAVKLIVRQVLEKKIKPEDINEDLFEKFLATNDMPDPELLIRTSGEFRISNFLLWQIAYTELYFTDKLWPDFTKEDFYEAIVNFQTRERRFGMTSEQVTINQ
jgi:undecaprenyl diphosphate synthase